MAYVHGLYFKSRFSRVFLRSHLHDININTPKISIQSYCTQDLGPILCRAKFKIIHSFQQNWKIFVLDDKYLIPTTGYKWGGGRHNAKTGPFYFRTQNFFGLDIWHLFIRHSLCDRLSHVTNHVEY